MTRAAPNVLVTGTPGTGKTTLCEQVAAATGLRHVNIGDLVKREQLHNGWDDEFECLVIDEDKVCDALEDMMGEGGVLVDYHGCDFFPERWFDLVVVLQTDNSVLWERLEKRAYSQKKIQENVQCEIMHCIVEEATDSYREEIVHVLQSSTPEDMEQNVEQLTQWARSWRPSSQHAVPRGSGARLPRLHICAGTRPHPAAAALAPPPSSVPMPSVVSRVLCLQSLFPDSQTPPNN